MTTACSLIGSSRACLPPSALTSPPLFLTTTLCIPPLIDKHCHRFYVKCTDLNLHLENLSFELSTLQGSPFGEPCLETCLQQDSWLPVPCQGAPWCARCHAYKQYLTSSLLSPARPVLGRFSPTLAKYAPSNNKLSCSIANYSCCTRDITSTLICPLISLSCLGSSRCFNSFLMHLSLGNLRRVKKSEHCSVIDGYGVC